jgi:predicted DNA-binding transcriptional regulator YafY
VICCFSNRFLVGPTVAEDPQFLDRIESAIKTRGSVFILYNGNTVPRKITPHEIVSGSLGKLVKAHCFLQNDERSFYVRMKRVERNDWTLARNGNVCFFIFIFISQTIK